MAERPLPRLVAATDRERLTKPDFAERLEALVAAGCPAVLLRGGGLTDLAFYKQVCESGTCCRAAGAALWVGDRADIARACGADAVQLPEHGMSIAGARRAAGPGVRVGRSVHSLARALAAAGDGVDHLVVGTIYASRSHPGIEPVGPELVARIRAALDARGTPVPVFGIGGLTPSRCQAVVAAGAAGVVAIRALWDAADPAAAVRAFSEALDSAP